MKCPKCGVEINDASKFCNECGEKIEIATVDKENVQITAPGDGLFYSTQLLTESEEKTVRKLEARMKRRDALGKFGTQVFGILWIIFGGLFNFIYVAICGIIEFISIVGIPSGIILFKSLPLVFNPVNKRVILHFKKHPVLNILWLVFGGALLAFIYEVYVFLLQLTIIGSPIAAQSQKVSKLLWAPFGAEIIGSREFSDEELEKVAYTIQYLRRKKVRVTKGEGGYECYADIWNIRKNIYELLLRRNDKLSQLISKILPGIVAGVIVLMMLVLPPDVRVLISGAIGSVMKIFLKLEVIIPIVSFFAGFITYISIIYKRQTTASNFGYSTRSELILKFDTEWELKPDYLENVKMFYHLYKTEIDAEIVKDR